MKHAKRFALCFLAAVLLCAHISTVAQSKQPRVFLMDAKTLMAQKQRVADPEFKLLFAKVEREAQQAIKAEFRSVMAKSVLPPSGDKHDYMSQAPYFWKDPSKKDGLPYIRRDGEKNPEIDNITDHESLDDLINAVEYLSIAYYFTGKQEYGDRAAVLLRMWFIDAKTKMNPNLEYAQFVPGQSSGRSFGIIETRGLSRVVDSIGLLAGSKAWKDADQKGVESWFDKFLDWLQTSKHGNEEANAKNNHGTWYDVQVGSLALFVGKNEFATKLLESAKQKRIETQIEPDGSQPLEIARTRSLSYSTMNLEAFVLLAKLGDATGVDLWNFQTKDGRSIRKAIDFLYPYAIGEKKWTTKQIIDFEPERLYSVMRLASEKYGDDQFKKMMSSVPKAAKFDPRAPLRN
ncbi:MAG: alginate lyase family protein [Pyrinomonadaceae bacterium]|nr:alginate lyase family protein [Chloracidobacterium sp.]MBP7376156.1 alginate lyase family protein [Pyrinomonadaceae bacterium]